MQIPTQTSIVFTKKIVRVSIEDKNRVDKLQENISY